MDYMPLSCNWIIAGFCLSPRDLFGHLKFLHLPNADVSSTKDFVC